MSDIMNGVDAVIGSIYMVLLVFVCAPAIPDSSVDSSFNR